MLVGSCLVLHGPAPNLPGPTTLLHHAHRLGEDESITHEVNERRLGVNVVEGVSSFQTLVSWVVHDGGGQRVEAQEVRHLPLGALKTKSDTSVTPQPLRGTLKPA